ncbi:hypothetical protein [Actinoplanes sp. NPDC049316]|uniref:hypothetical protein n=1 Tax=Actinoplanes sp. NPDC049316 TaxID=3154727 RepID=UPI00341C5C6D
MNFWLTLHSRTAPFHSVQDEVADRITRCYAGPAWLIRRFPARSSVRMDLLTHDKASVTVEHLKHHGCDRLRRLLDARTSLGQPKDDAHLNHDDGLMASTADDYAWLFEPFSCDFRDFEDAALAEASQEAGFVGDQGGGYTRHYAEAAFALASRLVRPDLTRAALEGATYVYASVPER